MIEVDCVIISLRSPSSKIFSQKISLSLNLLEGQYSILQFRHQSNIVGMIDISKMKQ